MSFQKMRIPLFLLLFFFTKNKVSAQHMIYKLDSAIEYPTASLETYIYRIPEDSILYYKESTILPEFNWMRAEAYRFSGNPSKYGNLYKHLDSFINSETLKPGYYYAVWANQGQIFNRMYHKPAFKYTVRNVGHIKLIEVFDMQDKPIKDLKIFSDSIELLYNNSHRAYILIPNDSSSTEVILKGRFDEQRFTIQRSKKEIEKKVSSNRERYNNSNNTDYVGYLVTNKPKYLPGDTIKFKAWLEMPDKKLVNEPMIVYLQGYGNNYTILKKLSKKEPGLYFSEFVLGDSIKTGIQYTLMLLGEKSGYKIAQQLIVEDYLLDETHLKVKVESKEKFQKNDSVQIFCAAVNANNLAVLDGTITQTVIVYYKESKGLAAYQDTLINTTIPVSPEGETNLSFYLNTVKNDVKYISCKVALVNSNFEQHDTLFYIPFTNESAYIRNKLSGNIFKSDLIKNKKSIKANGTYRMFSHNKWSLWKPMSFPFQRNLNDRDQTIEINADSMLYAQTTPAKEYFPVSQLDVQSDFIKDTAYLDISNPHLARVSYVYYEENTYRGFGYFEKDTLIKFHSPEGKTITVFTNFRLRNQIVENTYKIYRFDKDMQVEIVKKDFVYPGQKDSIRVRLTDNNNIPVNRTNLTVLAFNSNFTEDFTPELESDKILLPAYQTPYHEQTYNPSINTNITSQKATPEWLKKCAADTLFLYRKLFFLDGGFAAVCFPIPHSILPQISFYVKEGSSYILPEVIHVDGRPVYYSGAYSNNPKGFFVNKGFHQFTLRTHNATYTVSNIATDSNFKYIYFINSDNQSFAHIQSRYRYWATQSFFEERTVIHKQSQSPQLSDYELSNLQSHFFLYNTQNQKTPIHLIQYPYDYASTQYFGNRAYQSSGIALFGPLNPNEFVYFWESRLNKLKFRLEQNQLYNIKPGQLRLERTDLKNYLRANGLKVNNQWPLISYVHPNPETWETLYEQNKKVTYQETNEFAKVLAPDFTFLPRTPYTNNAHKAQLIVKTRMPFKYFILYKPEDASSVHIYEGKGNKIFDAKADKYNFIAVDFHNQVYRLADVTLKPNKLKEIFIDNNYSSESFDFNEPPSWMLPYINNDVFVQHTHSNGPSVIYGTITDEQNNPFPGVIVKVMKDGVVKGGTISEDDGSFSVKTNPGVYTIQFSSQGYGTKEISSITVSVGGSVKINNKMLVAGNNLNEVVKVAYREPVVSKNKTVSSSSIESAPTRNLADVASLSSNVQQSRNGGALRIGGAREDGTVYVMDGEASRQGRNTKQKVKQKAVNDDGKEISTEQEEEITSRKAKSFMNDFINNQMAASGMRKNFRDWAIWEPALWTDKQGNTSFKVVYPDNLTSWKTYFLAMNNKGYAVKVMNITKAFKPLSAELSMPRFLRSGDKVQILGKVANYTEQAIDISATFSKDGKELNKDSFKVNNSKVAYQMIKLPEVKSNDSSLTSLSFQLKTSSGYLDGEERSIPVFPVGTRQAYGHFFDLQNDSLMHSEPDPSKGFPENKTSVSVDAGLVDVMLREIENIKLDPHGCVEQMTTKLVAINFEEEIKMMMKDTNLNNEETKSKIISKLITAQNQNGSFGWWSGNNGDIRITNYVINALARSNSDVALSGIINNSLRFLHSNLDSMSEYNKIISLHSMAKGNYPLDYAYFFKHFDTIELNSQERLMVAEMKSVRNINNRADLDSVMKEMKIADKQYYWPGRRHDWYRDDMATTLLAYKLIKNDSVYQHLSGNILRYVLQARKNGSYQSTATTGLVLQTLLPDLLAKNKITDPKNYTTKVMMSGTVVDTITTFPKTQTVLSDKPKLTFQKTGISPAYVSVIYHYFNPIPEMYDSVFKITTCYVNNQKDTLEKLKQGEKVVLRVNVTAKKYADYVMLEIPIPAGCIPVQEKNVNRYREASREIFKDRVFIFCNWLDKGEYNFDIALEPRYKGVFNVNPARASMMYYPDEYGNSTLKKIVIE